MTKVSEELKSKIIFAVKVINEAYDENENAVLSYSGGKDSQALLRLIRFLNIKIPIIHNEHPGETIGDEKGIFIIKAPKSNTEEFFKYVKIDALIDGTRFDEDKDVVFNGELIHRSAMDSYKTEDGLFGKALYYPLCDFNDPAVYKLLDLNDDELAKVLHEV